MKTHNLRIAPEYFRSVEDGSKTFEIRINDRGFQVGDTLILQEWDTEKCDGYQGEGYTGREITRTVTHMTDFQQVKGYVVLALAAPAPSDKWMTIEWVEEMRKAAIDRHMGCTNDPVQSTANEFAYMVRQAILHDTEPITPTESGKEKPSLKWVDEIAQALHGNRVGGFVKTRGWNQDGEQERRIEDLLRLYGASFAERVKDHLTK